MFLPCQIYKGSLPESFFISRLSNWPFTILWLKAVEKGKQVILFKWIIVWRFLKNYCWKIKRFGSATQANLIFFFSSCDSTKTCSWPRKSILHLKDGKNEKGIKTCLVISQITDCLCTSALYIRILHSTSLNDFYWSSVYFRADKILDAYAVREI